MSQDRFRIPLGASLHAHDGFHPVERDMFIADEVERPHGGASLGHATHHMAPITCHLSIDVSWCTRNVVRGGARASMRSIEEFRDVEVRVGRVFGLDPNRLAL